MPHFRHPRRTLPTTRFASRDSIGRLAGGLFVAVALAWGAVAPVMAGTARTVVTSLQLETLGRAELVPVPADLQMTLILKVLGYDRNFDKRRWTTLHIGVVFVGSDPASSKVSSEIVAALGALSDKTLRKLPIQFSAVEYKTDSQIESVTRER